MASLAKTVDPLPVTIDDVRAAHGRIRAGVPLERAVCDHIASMTDRGAVREYHRLYDVDAQVLP